MRPPQHPTIARWLSGVALAAAALRPGAHAGGSVAYSFENYREEDGRITVQTQSSSAEQDLPDDAHLKLTGTLDAITGATPTGAPAQAGSGQVELTEMHERRKAWSGDLSRAFSRVTIDAGVADSRESDYVSFGWSLNALVDFNQKNTTLRVGGAGTEDNVEVFFEPAYLRKHTHDGILGVTQLIDPLTSVTFNLSWGRATGYLGEQRKLVEKSIVLLPGISLPEAFPESRPNERDKGSAFASVNHAVPILKGALEASYRFYHDTFGITAHTGEAAWIQHLGSEVIVEPSARLNIQSAANFYYYNLDATSLMPVRIPNGQGPFYSSDYRISALESTSYALKVTWSVNDRIRLDGSYRVYGMRGRDRTTPASAYPSAGISSAEVQLSW